MLIRSHHGFWLFASSLLLPACSSVLGADFDGLSKDSEAGVGGAAGASASGAGGAPATAAGGTASQAGRSGMAGTSGGRASAGAGGSPAGGMETAGTAGTSGAGAGGSPVGNGGSVGHGGASSAGMGGLGGTAGLGGTSGSGGSAGSGGYVSPTGLVLNELKGQGPGTDYIELYNRTAAPLDISGCYVSDDSNNRVTFPSGASIAATSYVLVRLQQATSTGMVTSCLGYTPCYDGISWGISASGEAIFLRDAKATLLDQLTYPDQNGASGLQDGQALGRIPDGGTTVGAVVVSPGAPNLAP